MWSRSLISLFSALIVTIGARAETSDPVGYVTFALQPGEKGAIQVNMVNNSRMFGAVSSVGPDHVDFSVPVPDDLMGAGGSAFLEIRSGPGRGSTIPVKGFSGKRLHLARSPMGLVDPGSVVSVRPDWTIAEMFHAPVATGMITSHTHALADTVGIFDPQQQTMKVYFFKTGQGWRQVGKEHEGDKSNDPIPFPTAPVYHRRGTTKLNFYVVGSVPMPYDVPRTVYVWPGRNLISVPFTSVSRLDDLFDSSDLVSQGSAPTSDTWKFHFPDGKSSRVMYFRNSEQWRYVGVGGDASGQRVEFGQSLDFNRRGDEAYIRFNTIQSTGARAARGVPAGKVLTVEPALSDYPAGVVGWRSQAGRRYQMQIQPLGQVDWQDHAEVLIADSEITRQACRIEGTGLIRILELP